MGFVPLPWRGSASLVGKWVPVSPRPCTAVGASCPAAALAHPLPADQSPPAAPHPAQLPLLRPPCSWPGLWAPGLVFLKSWGWWFPWPALPRASVPTAGHSLFPPPTSSAPSLITFLLPLMDVNGPPVWPCSLVALGTCLAGGGWREAPAGSQCPLCSLAGLRETERPLEL